MALPEISRPGIDAVGYGSRDFSEESKAIGAQLERFEEIRVSAAMELDSSIQDALRSTLSFQDRVKFDIGRIGDANVRALDQLLQEQVATNTQVTSDAAKFLQDRTIYLTKRLLEADAVEAQAIASELSDIREQAKRLADTERNAIDELAAVGSQGLGQVSLLREAFTKSLPTAESLVEGALGGGFVGKFASNVIRVRKARKQRRAALDAEVSAREGIEEGGEAAEGVEGVGDVPDVAAPTGGIGGDAVEELLKCICASTSKTATILAESIQSNVEKEKEKDRREERIVEALENIEDGDSVTVEEPGKKEGGIMGIISGVMSGLSLLGTGLRLIKNPKLAFRFFRMKLFRNVISPLKKNLGSIFGKGGTLRNLLGGVGGFFKNLAGTVSSGVKSAIGGVTSLVGKAAASPVGQAVSGAAKSVGGAIGKGAKALGKTKAGGFFSRIGGSLMKGVKAVGGGIASAGKAIGGVAKKAGGAVAGAAKFVGAKAKMAKDLLKSPVKFLTTKLGPKAGGTLGKFAKKIPIVGGAIEALMSGIDIMAIKNDPTMSPKEKKEAIGKRIGAGLGGIIGAVGGGVLGNLIPIPIVGGLVGSLLGDLAGRYVGEAIAGAIGGEKIYDALSFMLPDVGGAEAAQPSGAEPAQPSGAEAAQPSGAEAAQPSGADGPQVNAGTGAGMGGQGSPITAPTPTTQTAGNFLRAGAAQNANTQLAMSAPGGASVTNTAQSNTAVTTNQFMGGTLRTRNTHETIALVSQDRLAYGLA